MVYYATGCLLDSLEHGDYWVWVLTSRNLSVMQLVGVLDYLNRAQVLRIVKTVLNSFDDFASLDQPQDRLNLFSEDEKCVVQPYSTNLLLAAQLADLQE